VEGELFVGGQTTKIAITGLGGVGKTQLVLELVYRIRDRYKNCIVIWIPAIGIESLHQSYLDVARQLKIPGSDEDKADAKKLVQAYLSKESAGRWLLVFDNADDVNMWIKSGPDPGSNRLIDYLPRSEQGCIIFTTRDRKTAVKLAHQNIIEVPEMDDDVAIELLQKCLVNSDLVNDTLDTVTLLKELSYLPLAIVQAAAYINENGITLTEYQSLLTDQEEEVIDLLSEEFEDDGRYDNIKNPVATTWLISFEQIRHRDPLAADYLSFMCCINPKAIPQSLLPLGPSRKKELEAIGTLNAYSFVSKRPADLALDLHRLVHLATRNWLRKEKLLAHLTKEAIKRLQGVFPDEDYKNRSVWRMYLPHARYVLESNLVDKDWENRMGLLWRYGICLNADGRWNEAEAAITEVLEIEKRDLGVDHPSTLLSLNNLVVIYQNQGRFKEAEDIQTRLLELNEKVLGAEHPNTLLNMNNLAHNYTQQGQWKEAEDIQTRLLELNEKVLGAEHPNTLLNMNNLAHNYTQQGQWKEAEDIQTRLLELNEKVLGAEHPNTLMNINNLAHNYTQQGRWKEAEDIQIRLHKLNEKVLGAEHPQTLINMNNLAGNYIQQGRWKEAEDIQTRLLELNEKLLGAEHPSTLTSMVNLASTLWNQGRWKEAEDLEVQVMETRLRVFGAEHPSTLTSMANLASTFWNQGRWKEAEDLEVQVMETRLRLFGAEHPSTLTSMNNLAFTWKRQGQDKEALKLMEECVAVQSRTIGINHPHTVSSRTVLLRWQTE
jgi:tetratricopeptide (TPR) repeat protein